MQPSSLIFLVVIGVWVAYLVSHRVRRGEHLATARSVDAFTETMRVLGRRDPLPHTDLDSAPSRSYAVSPTRAVRPQVTVKRAETPAPAARPAGATAYRMRPSRATRGLSLLACLAATLVYAVLCAVGVLRWWAFVIPLALAVGAFFWLRAGVQGEVAVRRAARAPRAVSVAAEPEDVAVADEDIAVAPDPEVAVVVTEPIPAAPEPAPSPAVPSSAVASSTVASRTVVEVDEDDIPLTWDPRPVPPPTYTLKARAPERRPLVRPEAPVAVDDEADARRDPARRRIVNG